MGNENYCMISENYIVLHEKLEMNLKNQKNGNDQLNSIRNEFNDRLRNYSWANQIEFNGQILEDFELSKSL